MCVLVIQPCPPLWDPMDCSLPSSSVSGIFQARILEWVAIFFSGDLPDPGVDPVSPALSGGFFTIWVTRKAHHKIYDPWNKGQKDERSKLITYGIIDDLYILFLFLNFFWCGPFLKPLLNLLQRSFCFVGLWGFVLLFWPWGKWDLSTPTGDETCIPCFGRQSLTHWTAREVPTSFPFAFLFS